MMSINNSLSMEELKKWYHARDVFIGDNYQDCNPAKGLELAKDCKHEDAVWLCETFKDQIFTTPYDIITILVPLSLGDDKRILYFTAAMMWFNFYKTSKNPTELLTVIFNLLMRSTFAGCYSAQAFLIWIFEEQPELDPDEFNLGPQILDLNDPEILFFYKNKSFSRISDPRTLYMLGQSGNIKDEISYYKRAAELGYVDAICRYAKFAFNEHNYEGWHWLCQTIHCGKDKHKFINKVMKYMKLSYGKGPSTSKIIFLIGKTLKTYRHVYPIDETYRHGAMGHGSRKIPPEEKCIDSVIYLYDKYCENARKAVDTWTIIAKRSNIVKDVRQLIAKLIWNSRSDADYDIEEEPKHKRSRV